MLLVFFQIRRIVEFTNQAIDPGPDKATATQFTKHMQVLALASTYNRRQHHNARVRRQRHHLVHHLAHGLRFKLDVVVRAMGFAHPRKHQPQIIIDLRNGAHGGSRIMRSGFLFNRNRRRQTLDMIDVRFLHNREKLPRIGGQRFHITTLTFGIKRIKRQRRFARTRKPGNNYQFVAGDSNINILKIMSARTPYNNMIHDKLKAEGETTHYLKFQAPE